MSTMVVIRCPETDKEVPIGILMDLHSFALLPATRMKLKCPACGHRHTWSRKDAYLSVVSRNRNTPGKR